jgi:F-type H+-transporting ATPase subunit epsilon
VALPTALDVRLITPRGIVAHVDTDGLTAPGELGEFELLPGHVPMLTALKPGVLTIGDRHRTRYAVAIGYLRVDPANSVEVLVDQAVSGGEIDVEEAKADFAKAKAELDTWGDKPCNGDWKNANHRLQWAQARLDAASS